MTGFDYQDTLNGIFAEVNKIVENADRNINPVLNQIGSVVAVNVEMVAPVSDEDFYYYKGKKVSNTHIKDDVVYRVKKSRKMDCKYVSIGGGKKTWAKWHLANDGHVAENGKFVPGNHFVEKAVLKSEDKIESLVDAFVKGVVQ